MRKHVKVELTVLCEIASHHIDTIRLIKNVFPSYRYHKVDKKRLILLQRCYSYNPDQDWGFRVNNISNNISKTCVVVEEKFKACLCYPSKNPGKVLILAKIKNGD